jgi:hypothetical protein
MGLFKPDLYRSFAIGFGAGVLIMAFQIFAKFGFGI